jgi:hypothetical protein|tara:strand:- start:321 stop:6245 length:5925 start_codon:yes stop_codon:yes gene_type:complete
MESKSSEEINKVELELQDIIQITAPNNELLNNKIFIISYISSEKIKITNIETFNDSTLFIDINGDLEDESIIEISLLSRDEEEGYARQNNLIPGTWIDMHFGGDIPEIITGEISNLEGDMIEIKLYPTNDVIYIDFGYKGISPELNITSINIRSAPENVISSLDKQQLQEQQLQEQQLQDQQLQQEGIAIEEMTLYPYDETDSTQDVKERIREYFIKDDDIFFGDELESITQEVRVDDDKLRYSIDNQTSDLLNDLLSTIPTTSRTNGVLSKLHLMIERYKQLREIYSDFDNYGNAMMPKLKTADYKPLIDNLKNLNKKLHWVIPVVKNIKKLYDIDESEASEYNDILSSTLAESRFKETNIIENYYTNNQPEDQNKYTYLLKELNPLLEKSNIPYSSDDLLAIVETHANINTVVDNLGDYYSSIAKKDNIRRVKFLIDTYTTALTKLIDIEPKSSRFTVKRENVTNNSMVPIKSFLFLSEPVVRYSRINLPGTNILTRASLNSYPFYYYRFLNNKTVVDTVTIDDFTNKIDYESNDFLKNPTEYVLADYIEAGEKLDKYLDHVIPKTKELFNIVKKYISGKLSLYGVVSYLEPFGIYLSDLTYMQYKDMNNFIEDKIIDYKKIYANKFKIYRNLGKGIKQYNNSLNLKKLYNILRDLGSTSQIDLQKIVFEDSYLIKKEVDNISSSELMKQILDLDGGLLLMTAISLSNSYLLSSLDINDEIESLNKNYIENIESEKENNKCKKYILSKKYKALDELNDDNDKLLYFDSKLDPTRYEIIDEYQNERKSMNKKEFMNFMIDVLKKTIGLNDEDAREDAIAMIDGKKTINDGFYAVLEEEDAPSRYFIRENNKWIIDDTIPSINVENNDLFCNVQSKCFKIKQTCADVELSDSLLKQKSLEEILNEFDVKYEISKEQLILLLSNRVNYLQSYISSVIKINHFQKYKYNDANYKAGLNFIDDEFIQLSPYQGIYELILGQSDFVKKQGDLFKLCNKFTRVALENENKWFRYCNTTNIPLVPTFQYELAEAWVTNSDTNQFFTLTEIIKKRQGKLSDDGDSWVDEHTGRKICEQSYDTEEGYDAQGRKLLSREIIEAELKVANNATEETKLESQINESTPETKVCLIILNAMSKFMGISLNNIQFIISNAILTNTKALGSKESYEKKAEALLKKRNKKLPDWETINTQSLVLMTLTYMIIGIQIEVPPIKTRKTVPGCVKSFKGYPLDGGNDYSNIEYIACVAAKISSSTSPWNTIKRLGVASISKTIKSNIEKYILINEDIQIKFKEKIEWLLLNEGNDIPSELEIEKWQEFRPPLKPIIIKTIENVTNEFKERLLRNMKTGNVEQEEQINIIKGKIQSFSISMMMKIQDIINSKKPLLTNSADEPFIENMCCQEYVDSNFLSYFSREDKTIETINDIVITLSNIIHDVINIPKAEMILSSEDTRLIYPQLTSQFSEETKYLCFINYCNFSNVTPIPDSIKPLCVSKPDGFDKFMPIQDQIKFLEREGKNFSEKELEHLLKINNRNNIVLLDIEKEEISDIQKLRNLLDYFSEIDDSNIPEILINKMNELLDNFSFDIKEDTPLLKDLTNYLSSSNKMMREEILNYINDHSKMKQSYKRKIQQFINTFHKFNNYRSDISNGYYSFIEDESVYRIFTFIKNMIYEMIKVYPNIIINKVDYKNINVPNYWKLSERHKKTFKNMIQDYYKILAKYQEDDSMKELFNIIIQKVTNIYLLSENLICFASLIKDKDVIYSIFNKESVTKLFEYCFLSIIREHIIAVNDVVVKTVKKSKDISQVVTSLEAQSELTGELVDELEIISGEKLDLNSKLTEYLCEIMGIFMSTKQNINYSNEDIKDLVNRAKEKEKDNITQKLKDFTDEEREIDTELKKHKLGDWGIGLQKGLTQYVADFYDKELENAENTELLMRQADNLGLSDRIEDLDYDNRITSEIEKEVNDLSLLAEDEGQNYEDDGDEFY